MKRIIFCVTNDLTYDRRMIRIAGSLVSGGFEVTFVGRQLPHSIPIKDQSFSQYRIRCIFNKGILFYLEYNIRLWWYLLTHRHDIIGAIDDDTLAAAAFASYLKRTKLTFDAHEYFTEVPELVGKPIKKYIWRWVEKRCIPRAELCYTVSASICDIYTKRFQKPFALIRNVPDRSADAPAGQLEKRTIIYQGALNLGRGLEELIEAMKDVEATLLLAGEGDHSQMLRELAGSKPYHNRIQFLGFIAPAALSQITRKASIGYNVLLPLGESYRLSLSNKFFDYIQQGIPSLSSCFPEYERIIKEYPVGAMCECKPESIAKALNQMLRDATAYQEMVSACEVAAQEFNWQKEEQKLIELYHGL